MSKDHRKPKLRVRFTRDQRIWRSATEFISRRYS